MSSKTPAAAAKDQVKDQVKETAFELLKSMLNNIHPDNMNPKFVKEVTDKALEIAEHWHSR